MHHIKNDYGKHLSADCDIQHRPDKTPHLIAHVIHAGLLNIYWCILSYISEYYSKNSNIAFDHSWIIQRYGGNRDLWSLMTGKSCLFVKSTSCIKSCPPSAAYICLWAESWLVQVMAFRIFGAKPWTEQMLVYYQLDHSEHILVKFEWELYHFHSRKSILKCRQSKWGPFCLGEMI